MIQIGPFRRRGSCQRTEYGIGKAAPIPAQSPSDSLDETNRLIDRGRMGNLRHIQDLIRAQPKHHLDNKRQPFNRAITHRIYSPIKRRPVPFHAVNQVNGQATIPGIKTRFRNESFHRLIGQHARLLGGQENTERGEPRRGVG